jgi:hypothetical protein
MSPTIPKKQWAQVIEKTGGPVEYKEIDVQQPGPDEVLVNIKYSGVCTSTTPTRTPPTEPLTDDLQATPTYTPSTATGRSRPNFHSSAATRAPASWWQRAIWSTTLRCELCPLEP